MQINVTLGTIKTGIISTGPNAGQPYASAQGSTVHYKTVGDKTRTLTAFGPDLAKVADIFVEGANVNLTAFNDRGSLLVRGPARQKAAAAAEGEGEAIAA